MKVTAEAVSELNALAGRTGRLTPEQVLEAAADESSALHDCFTWDDSEAAARWRVEEARELIRSVRIEVTIEEKTIRSVAYVRDPDKGQNEAGYVGTLKVCKRSGDVLRSELSAIAALLERAIGIAQAQEREDVAGKMIGIKAQVTRLADGL